MEGQQEAGGADMAAGRAEGAAPAAEAGPAVVQRRILRTTQTEYPNHVWAYDFVADRTHDGKAYRMLTVIDEFSRECLSIVAGRKIDSSDVLYTLADLFIRCGIPTHIRSDNGPEFCARRSGSGYRDWALERCSSSRAVLGRTDSSSRSTGSCGTSC